MRITPSTDQRVGFTLIELLVVISIIALLIGILLPALGNARATARSIVCASSQKGIGLAMVAYALDNEDVYTGPNTSGADHRSVRGSSLFGMHGDTSSVTPTAVWDWMSPMLGDSMNFSPNRAKRTSQIFNDLSCPEASLSIDSLFGNWTDSDDFEFVFEQGESFRQISYLTPAPFHFYSADHGRSGAPRIGGSNARYWVGFEDPAVTPKSFRPGLNRVGTQPSAKIFTADGTRYLDDSNGFILDFDLNPASRIYSSFGTSTPIFDESRAYGRSTVPDSNLNAELSMRHREGTNALYFDGHVGSITQQEMYENPNPWFPTGSEFTFNRATPESVAYMERQQGTSAKALIH